MSTFRPSRSHEDLNLGTQHRSIPVGLPSLVLSKAADTTTTLIGLQFVPFVFESNPHLRMLMASIGSIPALLLGTVAVLGLVVGVTESARLACQRFDCDVDSAERMVRFVGYVPLSIVFLAASLHNLLVVLTGLGALG